MRYFLTILLITASLTFLPHTANAQQEQSAIVGQIQEAHKLPGLATLVIQDKKIVGMGISGVKEFGKAGSLEFSNRYHLGGCAKPITAMLCAFLIEQGQFNWNSTVADLYPRLPETVDEAWKKVTLKQLLSNQAGLPDDSQANTLAIQERLRVLYNKPVDARDALMLGLFASKPAYDPGSKTLPCNSGFVIAAHLIEVALNIPYEDLMTRFIFTPLKLTTVGFGPPPFAPTYDLNNKLIEPAPVEPVEPRGHTLEGQPVQPDSQKADTYTAWTPAGRFHMSFNDWIKVATIQLSGARGEPILLKNADSFQTMMTPVDEEGHAMGWLVQKNQKWAAGDVLTSEGSNGFWYSLMWLAPKKNMIILVATNQGGPDAEKAVKELASEMAKIYGDK